MKNNPNILYMLARYYADHGDYEASTKQYQSLMELDGFKIMKKI